MGAFFIYRTESDINADRAMEVFRERGFGQPERLAAGSLSILLYPKILVKNHVNLVKKGEDFLFATGTLAYRGRNHAGSMELIFDELHNGRFEAAELQGAYFIFMRSGAGASYFNDPGNIYNVYHDDGPDCLSSSFLAVCRAHPGHLSVNRNAAAEMLLTGNLSGCDTLFSQVSRLSHRSPVSIGQAEFRSPADADRDKQFPLAANFSGHPDEQAALLDKYFSGLKAFDSEYGFDMGITGGLDSRLLLILGKRSFKNLSCHTHSRKTVSTEIIVAKELCDRAGLELNMSPVKHPQDMTEEELIETMEASCRFYDGHIRSHIYWWEEYNTLEYRRKILKDKRFGLSGVGGEQYRNAERITRGYRGPDRFIKYEYIIRNAGHVACKGERLEELTGYTGEKWKKELDLADGARLGKQAIKRIFNEIINPAGRAVRVSAENQYAYFLAPFTDPLLSIPAYATIPYHGPGFQYEMDLIARLDGRLASVVSDYGFAFNRKEPACGRMVTRLKNSLHPGTWFRLVNAYKFSRRKNTAGLFADKFPAFRQFYKNVENLGLGIDLKTLLKIPDLSPLVYELGYFLKKFSDLRITTNDF
jgi:hypothetical protein